MSSILTNTSAMAALSTLRAVNKNLGAVQGEISTGQSIANAKHNPAYWAISATMRSDVGGFKAIADSLALGGATLAVARDGTQALVDQLTLLRDRVIAGHEDNIDRDKVDRDVQELKQQIRSTIDASQFNGLNMLTSRAFGEGEEIDFVSSLNRTPEDKLDVSRISVPRANLRTEAGTLVAGLHSDTTGLNGDDALGHNHDATSPSGSTAFATITPPATADIVTADPPGPAVFAINVGTALARAEVPAGMSAADAHTLIADRINAAASPEATAVATAGGVTISNNMPQEIAIKTRVSDPSTGGFFALDSISVKTREAAQRALVDVEGMLRLAIDAGAAFGAAEKRMEISDEFVSKVADSLTRGVGAIVDADMEAASARLQALQVQQQLGTQALSIANQQPQSILALFQG